MAWITRFIGALAAMLIVPAGWAAEASLVGLWTVTVEGEAQTRTLHITEAATTDDGALLAARYAITGARLGTIEARMVRAAGVRRLQFTTQAGTAVVADERADGTFAGTFTLKSGAVRGVSIARGGDAATAPAGPPPDPSAMRPLEADVPAGCAALHGAWQGRWSTGVAGERFLRVVEVRALPGGGCTARFSYGESRSPVPARLRAEIKDGVLAFVCNTATGGSCRFRRDGSMVAASYADSAGGSNSGAFRPLPE